MNNNLKKNDKYLTGIFLGLVSPIVIMFLVYLFRFNGRFSLSEFIDKMYLVNALSPLLSLCAIVNLGIFFLFYQFWYNNAARGVIMATLFYAVVILILKLK